MVESRHDKLPIESAPQKSPNFGKLVRGRQNAHSA